MAAIPGLSRNVTLRNGVTMPRVGLGTFRSKGEEVTLAVKAALQCGIRAIDTASIYKNEAEIGAAIRGLSIPRDELFITSKISPYQQGREKARAACEETLQRLGTGYVDLMLIHWPGVSKTPLDSPINAEKRLETWRVLEELYFDGRIRAIGVSNFELRHLEELEGLAEVKPMVNQVECHPKYPQDQLRARCAELGITVVAYASLGQGELLCDPVVQAVAEACGRTPAQVLLRWGIEKGCCVIPKSVTPARVEGFAEDCLLSWRLGDEEMERLSSLASVPHKFCWDPAGVL